MGIAAALVMSVGGCISRAAKEVFLTPKGFSVPTSASGAGQMSFSKVQLAEFTNTGIATMPGHMNQLLRTALTTRLSELSPKKAVLDPASSKVLAIRGQYVYYEEAGSILDQAFGPFEEIIALVELADQSSGQIIARGYCIGRTNTTVLQGPERKAEGLAKAIVDFIRKNCKSPPHPE